MISLLAGGSLLLTLTLWPLRRALGTKSRSATLLTLTLPLAALGLYLLLGSPQAMTPSPSRLLRKQAEHLTARLEQQPVDPGGWAALARTYRLLGRNAAAAAAFERAGPYLEQRPQLLVEYAQVLAAERQGFAGAPTQLLERALARAPQHLPALMLAGRAAYERGDMRGAADYWSRARRQLPPGSAMAGELDARLAAAKAAEAD